MPRAIWKGAISFGLVNVPIALYPASEEIGIDFDWLDKRSMDPVGYKRINKRTGKAIEGDDIVKGIKQDDGDYVVLSDEQVKAAYPKSTQIIEIETFVKAAEIDLVLLEKPYYLEPSGKGADKVYALLRESMREAGVVGIARVVMHTKEHLAALMPAGPALILNTIRWASEIRPMSELKLPADGKAAADLKPGDLKMAAQLISNMTGKWKPADYTETFSAAVHELVKRKIKAGETESVTPVEDASTEERSSNVIDLTELLARSLKRKSDTAGKAPPNAKPKATPRSKKAAAKPPAKQG
ncbi:MAG TPA: Ku protein [Rhizobiaceae bacterium]|nr:Ku protein [Rhizobiaceae bacterium]